ncbi:MAG: hypothetical protein AAGB01_09880 [Cyanobacteria bacterium P01_F01_bin.42]
MRSLFELVELEEDSELYQSVMRLHQLTVLGRWCLVLVLWLTVGIVSLWQMIPNIQLALEHFTWAAVRTAFRYNYWAGIGLTFCVALTFSVLLWQSRNILFGLPNPDQKRLVERLLKIRDQGPSHPLWKWVCTRQ